MTWIWLFCLVSWSRFCFASEERAEQNHKRCSLDSIESMTDFRGCIEHFFVVLPREDLKKSLVLLESKFKPGSVIDEAMEAAFRLDFIEVFFDLIHLNSSAAIAPEDAFMYLAIRKQKNQFVKRFLELYKYDPNHLIKMAQSNANNVAVAMIIQQFPEEVPFESAYACFRELWEKGTPDFHLYFQPKIMADPYKWIAKIPKEHSLNEALKLYSVLAQIIPEEKLCPMKFLRSLSIVYGSETFDHKTIARSIVPRLQLTPSNFLDDMQYGLPCWIVLEIYDQLGLSKTERHFQDCSKMIENELYISSAQGDLNSPHRSYKEMVPFAYFWAHVDTEERFYINMFFDKHGFLLGKMQDVMFRQWTTNSNWRILDIMRRHLNREDFEMPRLFDDLVRDLEQVQTWSNSNPFTMAKIYALDIDESLTIDMYTINGLNLMSMHATIVKVTKMGVDNFLVCVFDSSAGTEDRPPLYYHYVQATLNDLAIMFKPLPDHSILSFHGLTGVFEGGDNEKGHKQSSHSCTCFRFRHFAKVSLGINDYMVWKVGLTLGLLEMTSADFDGIVRKQWNSPIVPVWTMITKIPYFEKRLLKQIDRMTNNKAAATLRDRIHDSVTRRYRVLDPHKIIQASI